MEIKDEYLIHFEEFENLPLSELVNRLKTIRGKKLCELRLMDLSYHNGELIFPGEGVYFFREGKKFVYIGKVSSMSFTERLPKHLDVRMNAWFNTMLKMVCERHYGNPLDQEHLRKTSKIIFENLDVVLLNVLDNNKQNKKINKLERLLIHVLQPINSHKNTIEFNHQYLLKELLK